jgi:hypothetical protein
LVRHAVVWVEQLDVAQAAQLTEVDVELLPPLLAVPPVAFKPPVACVPVVAVPPVLIVAPPPVPAPEPESLLLLHATTDDVKTAAIPKVLNMSMFVSNWMNGHPQVLPSKLRQVEGVC